MQTFLRAIIAAIIVLAVMAGFMGSRVSAQESALAVYPPMAPCDGEIFTFWFDGDNLVPGYLACDIAGAVDLGTYQATCPDGLEFSPASGGCIFPDGSADGESPIGGVDDPETGEPGPVVYDYYYIGYTDGDGANCRAAATTDSEIVTALPEGTPVAVDLYQGDWARLAFEDGTSCFVLAQFLSDTQPVVEQEPVEEDELPTEIDVPADNLPETTNIGDGSSEIESVYQLPNAGIGFFGPTPHQVPGILFAVALVAGLSGGIIRWLGHRTAFGVNLTSDYTKEG